MVFLLIISSIVPAEINIMDPRQLATYPNYLLIYAMHHYNPQLLAILVTIMYYSKSPQLVNFHKRLWTEFFRSLGKLFFRS